MNQKQFSFKMFGVIANDYTQCLGTKTYPTARDAYEAMLKDVQQRTKEMIDDAKSKGSCLDGIEQHVDNQSVCIDITDGDNWLTWNLFSVKPKKDGMLAISIDLSKADLADIDVKAYTARIGFIVNGLLPRDVLKQKAAAALAPKDECVNTNEQCPFCHSRNVSNTDDEMFCDDCNGTWPVR